MARAAAATLLASVLLAAAPAAGESTLERIKANNRVTVAIADEAPYGFRDGQGRVTGEAPEIARVVLSRIEPEIAIDFVSLDFGQLIPALEDGRIDIAAAGMFITPERCARVAFSNPTYVIGEAFAVRAGNPRRLTDYRAVSDSPDAKVGLISGTVEYNYALVAGIPADRALLYSTFEKGLEALKLGDVDAVGLTSLTAQNLVADQPDLAATPQFYPEIDGAIVKGYGGFAFRREDRDLVAAFDAELADFVGSGAHLALVERFGFGPDMLPDTTAAALCEE